MFFRFLFFTCVETCTNEFAVITCKYSPSVFTRHLLHAVFKDSKVSDDTQKTQNYLAWSETPHWDQFHYTYARPDSIDVAININCSLQGHYFKNYLEILSDLELPCEENIYIFFSDETLKMLILNMSSQLHNFVGLFINQHAKMRTEAWCSH